LTGQAGLGARGKSKRNETRAERNIRWIGEVCRVPDGRDVGKKLELREWQKAELKKIYDNPAGTRRAILSFGRKNGKTAFAACLLLLHLCGPEAKANSQLYSAANSREQAAVLFGLASKMVRMSPDLAPFITVRDTVKQLYCKEKGTLYRALSKDVPTAYGLSPAFIVHDELGQIKGARSELYDALETATGAQGDPLSVIISTQAATDADLLSILIDDALTGRDPRTTISLHTAPLHLDPFSDEAMKAANPALGDFLNHIETRDQAEQARAMPSREPEYRNLILNQRVTAIAPFVSRTIWKDNGAQTYEFPRTAEIYGGLDLSATADLTALILIGKIDGKWHVKPYFWLPEDGLVDKARADREPYDMWAKQGYLLTSPGRSVDYEYVATFLRGLFDQFNIVKLGFDRWAFRFLRPWLIKAGFSEDEIALKFEEFGQGTKSMTPALRDLESELLNRRIAHGNHPVLEMCARNAAVEGTDENRKLSKQKSRGRIDGMVALANAFGVAPLNKPEAESVYKRRGVLVM
jgi:phage terminase large subunit-like protein